MVNIQMDVITSSQITRESNISFTKKEPLFCPTDDDYTFLEKGREYANSSTTHKYTPQEMQMMAKFESLEYLPSHSQSYKEYIKKQPSHHSLLQWLMMGLIGFSVGIIGFLLHQLLDLISDFKWNYALKLFYDKGIIFVWIWISGFASLLVMLSASLVVYYRPQAGSSGIPELIGFLNGTVIRHIFNIKTLVVKFCSCLLAVSAGLPIGQEGPMIHMGSLVGAGLSQFKSDTMHFRLPCFQSFRNFEDRRNFISAGAAAGIASAFGAPVGGVLFSMEEVSSFWNAQLTWQIFFCAMISTATTELLNSCFKAFVYDGSFGVFKSEEYILFQVQNLLPINILTFVPAILLGVIGGLLGALFTFLNLKIVRGRNKILASFNSKTMRDILRIVEPVLIMLIVATIVVFIPPLFACNKYSCITSNNSSISTSCEYNEAEICVDEKVSSYGCQQQDVDSKNYINATYNELSTLLFGSTMKGIHHLFSRNTHVQLGFVSMSIVLVYYFFMACWASGTSVASGILVPMLFIGGLYGRMIGLGLVQTFGKLTDGDVYTSWMDPGAFALVGAASFFGGVSRLTMSLTVIMVEMTNDVQFLLPIMAAIMVSKWVGDFFTHAFYVAHVELKCIPYLDQLHSQIHIGKKKFNLELFSASEIMMHPVKVVRLRESIGNLARLLLSNNHGGFPVIKPTTDNDLRPNNNIINQEQGNGNQEQGNGNQERGNGGNQNVFIGFINTLQLTVLLKHKEIFLPPNSYNSNVIVEYIHLTLDKLEDPEKIRSMLLEFSQIENYNHLFLNLEPYINQSAVSVPSRFSLKRTYIIFQNLGLRHITVVDEHNRVVGIITRKDLLPFNLQKKLGEKIEEGDWPITNEENFSSNSSVNSAFTAEPDHQRDEIGVDLSTSQEEHPLLINI